MSVKQYREWHPSQSYLLPPSPLECRKAEPASEEEGAGGFVQAYNCQAMVDGPSQVIVARAVTNQAADPEHLEAMLLQTGANCGHLPAKLSADAGYWSTRNADACEAAGIDAYISVRRQKHGARQADEAPTLGDTLGPRERMSRKLQSPQGKEVYSRRKAIVEPVFGQTKSCRGLRSFLMRGTEKVRGEWSLGCTGQSSSGRWGAAR